VRDEGPYEDDRHDLDLHLDEAVAVVLIDLRMADLADDQIDERILISALTIQTRVVPEHVAAENLTLILTMMVSQTV